MGQKVNPHGLRVGVIKDWDSKWYAEKDFADNLVEDYNIRTFLKKKLYSAGVAKIEIERASERVKVIIYTAKPGVVIGKGGSEIEKVKKELQKYTTKKLIVDIKEVKRPDKECSAGSRKHRTAAGKPYFLPSCYEIYNAENNESRSKRNQNIRIRTSWWSRYGSYRVLQRRNYSASDTESRY